VPVRFRPSAPNTYDFLEKFREIYKNRKSSKALINIV
jgi:hypothetical protein